MYLVRIFHRIPQFHSFPSYSYMLYFFVFLGLDGAITKLNRHQNRRYRDTWKWISNSFPRSLQYFRIDTTAFSCFLLFPPFTFLSSYLNRYCRCSKRQSRKSKRRGECENTSRPVSIDFLERRLESVGWEIEIRIEFARAWIEIGHRSALLKAKNRQKVLWQPRLLSKSRHSNRPDARNILLSLLSLATGRLLARVPNRPLIKSTLTLSPSRIRRKHFRESTWRKYLEISATVAGTEQKQDASIFAQNLPHRSL